MTQQAHPSASVSRWLTWRWLRPDRVVAGDHEVVHERRRLVGGSEQSIPYRRVAQTIVRRGLFWATLKVESTGGHKIEVSGLSKRQASEVREVVEARAREVAA